MPKARKKELIACQFYNWKLGIRGGVYFADGRSGNPINLGRHSLGTKDKNEALKALKRLDEQMAVKNGLITKEQLECEQDGTQLMLEEGWDCYRASLARPKVMGGVTVSTIKRYRAVFDKFILFAHERGKSYWQQVNLDLLTAYASWLDGESYAYRTEYLELTTLQQTINWLIETKRLPATQKVHLELRKPTGTDTYCWTIDEAQAIVERCDSDTSLHWLGYVLTALATTGLRISELAALRWSDIDSDRNLVTITDETTQASRKKAGTVRSTKSSRSRSFPLHDELRRVLEKMTGRKAGPIFFGPLGGKLKPDTVRNVLIREVLTPLKKRFHNDEETIGFKNGRLHSFRHYFCSVCANSNVPEMMVMEWLGHRDSAMVRHYYHMNDAEAQRRMSQISFVGTGGGKVLPLDSNLEGAKAVERTAS